MCWGEDVGGVCWNGGAATIGAKRKSLHGLRLQWRVVVGRSRAVLQTGWIRGGQPGCGGVPARRWKAAPKSVIGKEEAVVKT